MLPLYLTDYLALDTQRMGVVVSAIGFGGFIGQFALPGLSDFVGRRSAEVRRYGLNSLRLTAIALEQWSFPHTMVVPLKHVDDLTAFEGALLRGAFEVASRLTTEDYDRLLELAEPAVLALMPRNITPDDVDKPESPSEPASA